MRRLVLIHGRAQQHKDAVELKREWLDALVEGLRRSDVDVSVDELDAVTRFPYYGQALFDLVGGADSDDVAPIPVRGSDDAIELAGAMLREIAEAQGVSNDEILAAVDAVASVEIGRDPERAFQNWRLVRGIAMALNRLPRVSGLGVALRTGDVAQYLKVLSIQDFIESGVREAMSPEVETVVVGHSLGSVVAYRLLRRDGAKLGWRVPLLVTLGSPLGVTAIRRTLGTDKRLECVGAWYNAFDKDDIVAIQPVGREYYRNVENSAHVVNDTSNQHGIVGYLSDKQVAMRIYAALTAQGGE